MSQTDAQAALAAAAQIVANNGYAPSPLTAEQVTLHMADRFLSWLQHGRPAPDERLIPNEDFRSPSAARTERIDPSAVLAAANRATAPLDQIPRSPGASYAGVHMLASEHCVTPSGKRACQCGQAWPCSQSPAARRLRGETMP